MFYENLSYTEMMLKLWGSGKVTAEDKEWLDDISTRKILRFSERDQLVRLMIQIFGEPSWKK